MLLVRKIMYTKIAFTECTMHAINILTSYLVVFPYEFHPPTPLHCVH